MTTTTHLIPLLLADPSPCLRLRVLIELNHAAAEDAEALELKAMRSVDPLVQDLLTLQEPDGSWKRSDLPGSTQESRLLGTAQALLRLGLLGFGPQDQAVQKAAGYLFSCQMEDGSWPLIRSGEASETSEEKGYTMIPLQTSLPLRGLALCGYATHPQAEKAYLWLLDKRLPDGAWPTGIAAGIYGNVGGYRRLPHSRWGCRSNTTGALECLSLHPQYSHSPEALRGMDLLLGRESHEAHTLGFETARQLGAEPARGFLTYYARFDLLQILGLCARTGASPDDDRVKGIVDFVRGLQGPLGLWTYPPQPQVSRWVTLELLSALERLDALTGWSGLEVRTPYQSYPKRPRRY